MLLQELERGVSMQRKFHILLSIATVSTLLFSQGQSYPEFKPAPEVPAMPKALIKLPRTNISHAKYPVVDFHFHGSLLRSTQDYEKLVKLMDEVGVRVICNMDGGFGKNFDRNME